MRIFLCGFMRICAYQSAKYVTSYMRIWKTTVWPTLVLTDRSDVKKSCWFRFLWINWLSLNLWCASLYFHANLSPSNTPPPQSFQRKCNFQMSVKVVQCLRILRILSIVLIGGLTPCHALTCYDCRGSVIVVLFLFSCIWRAVFCVSIFCHHVVVR